MEDHVECRFFERLGSGDYVAYSEGVRYHLMMCPQCHRKYLAARQAAHLNRQTGAVQPVTGGRG